MQTQVVDKATGTLSSFESVNVVLDAPGFVKLQLSQDEILSTFKVGDDLIIQLVSGEIVTLENFYLADGAQTQSDLLLEDPESGEVLLAQKGADGSIFALTQVTSSADIAAVAPSTAAPVCPAVWAGLAALGVIALANGYSDDTPSESIDPFDPTEPPPPPGAPTPIPPPGSGPTPPPDGDADADSDADADADW